MRPGMKIATFSAALCITASVGVLMRVQIPQPRALPAAVLGYTSGKDCYNANGCATTAKFSACLDCCVSHCPLPWYEGCIDECIARFDPKDVYAALLESARAISAREGGPDIFSAKTVLVACQSSKDRRIAHVARLLAVESEDYGGITGIYQKRTP